MPAKASVNGTKAEFGAGTPSDFNVDADLDTDLGKAALRESLAIRLRELAEKPDAKS